MKPTADEEDILTASDAVDHIIETWDNIGYGKVNVEVNGVWLIVRRSGGGYSGFISLVDGTTVTILNDEATTHHVPEDLRPDDTLTDEMADDIEMAFSNQSGGIYPKSETRHMALNYHGAEGYRELLVGMEDDTFETKVA